MTSARWRLAWFGAVAFVALFGLGEITRWALGSIEEGSWWALDLQLVLDAGARFAAGEPLYADPKFLYPPLAAVATAPLQNVDPWPLSLAYAAAKVALVIAAAAWLTVGRPAPQRALAGIGGVLTLPFLHDLFLGNANTLIVAAMVPALFGSNRPRNGVLLGLVTAVFAKPFVVPVLLWLVVWRRPVAVGTIGTGLAATAVGILLAGVDAYVEWVGALAGGEARFAASFEGNHGVSALFPELWVPAAVVVGVALLVVLFRRGPAAGVAWALASGILIAPYAGTYSALPIALAIPVLGPAMPAVTLALVAVSPVATGHLLPVYAAAVLIVGLRLADGSRSASTGYRWYAQ